MLWLAAPQTRVIPVVKTSSGPHALAVWIQRGYESQQDQLLAEPPQRALWAALLRALNRFQSDFGVRSSMTVLRSPEAIVLVNCSSPYIEVQGLGFGV